MLLVATCAEGPMYVSSGKASPRGARPACPLPLWWGGHSSCCWASRMRLLLNSKPWRHHRCPPGVPSHWDAAQRTLHFLSLAGHPLQTHGKTPKVVKVQMMFWIHLIFCHRLIFPSACLPVELGGDCIYVCFGRSQQHQLKDTSVGAAVQFNWLKDTQGRAHCSLVPVIAWLKAFQRGINRLSLKILLKLLKSWVLNSLRIFWAGWIYISKPMKRTPVSHPQLYLRTVSANNLG